MGSGSRRPLARLNTAIAFAPTPIDRHLARYRAAGFALSDFIAAWNPGLRTGFVDLWPEDLELLTVVDEEAFERDASPQLRTQRRHRGVHALELYADDTSRLRTELIGLGIELPQVRQERLATTGPQDEPDFLFLDLPHLGRQPEVTALTSARPDAAMRRFVKVAPNGVFAMAGVTIVVDDPAASRRAWRHVIEPGVHELDFTRLQEWRSRCSDAGPGTGVVCLHLMSEDVDRTLAAMLSAGWERGQDIDAHPHVLPHPQDGVRFTLRHGEVEHWARQRREVLGEELQIRRPTT